MKEVSKNNQKYPKAYLEGKIDFYGREFIVTPDVLIPRPETEQAIDAIINLAGRPYLPGVKPTERKLTPHPKILDLGTGSGCIAITLKKEMPEIDIIATDISEKAIKIAQKNAAKHGIILPFIISDLLENVKFTPELIVANLPYVDEDWHWLDKEALSFEPSLALFAEDKGLFLIKKLINQSSKINVKYLVLEADPCQHEAIEAYAKKYNYAKLETRGYILVFVAF